MPCPHPIPGAYSVLPRFPYFLLALFVNLIFLHGPPASGKYTIGRELAALTGFELYHNHIVVDEVLQHHAFGTPAFVAARDHAWRRHLGAAALEPGRRLIFTFSPENTVPQTFVDWLFHEVPQQDGQLHSVALRLGEVEIESRLDSEQRRGFRKLTDHTLYRKLRDEGAFTRPRIPHTELILDCSHLSAGAAAARIARHFHLT